MTSHRAEPSPRYRARYGRLVILGVSLATTGVALLGGFGVLPSVADQDSRPGQASEQTRAAETRPDAETPAETELDTEVDDTALATTGETTGDTTAEQSEPRRERQQRADDTETTPALPDGSGEGRRAVFSESGQRVWMVGDEGEVLRSYLVSGSLTDNLDPGTYQVWSRSMDAIGIDGSTMRRFVRFTRGPTGAAIGFHDIPLDRGEKVQTRRELGTPLSHGCIRQGASDAKAMWRFAQLGTTVVVTV